MLSSCQWLPRADIKRLQDAALADIVLHAWRSAPFYRDRLAAADARRRHGRFKRLAQVPCLTRRRPAGQFRGSQKHLLSGLPWSGPPGKVFRVDRRTGGRPDHEFLRCRVGWWRMPVAWSWAKVDYSLNQVQIKPVSEGAAPYPGKRIDASWAPYWRDGASSGNWHLLDHTTAHNLQLEWLAKRGRCYLNTMPSNAAEIARRVALEPSLKPDLAGIFSLGEIVTDELRTRVRETLAAKSGIHIRRKNLAAWPGNARRDKSPRGGRTGAARGDG